MSSEPIAKGALVVLKGERSAELSMLAKESASILRALNAPAVLADHVTPDVDFVVLVVPQGYEASKIDLPDLKDRAGCAISVADDAAEGRVAVASARKRLRAQSASLGARELVFAPDQFGYLGLESDGARERLEILLRALVLDAERLRLKREGWEEP